MCLSMPVHKAFCASKSKSKKKSSHRFEGSDRNRHFRLVVRVLVNMRGLLVKLFGQRAIRVGLIHLGELTAVITFRINLDGQRLCHRENFHEEGEVAVRCINSHGCRIFLTLQPEVRQPFRRVKIDSLQATLSRVVSFHTQDLVHLGEFQT